MLVAHEMTIELLTVALVAITAFYACVTFRIMRANERTVSAMREQTEALVRPYVTVAVMTVPDSPVFYLRIANKGRTGAEDVRLTMDRDFFQYGQKTGRNLRTMAAFQQSIDQLAPGSEIIFGLAQAFVVFGQDADPSVTPTVFEVRAAYRYGERQVEEKTIVDLRPYHLSVERPDPLIDELQGIRKELEKIAKSREA